MSSCFLRESHFRVRKQKDWFLKRQTFQTDSDESFLEKSFSDKQINLILSCGEKYALTKTANISITQQQFNEYQCYRLVMYNFVN